MLGLVFFVAMAVPPPHVFINVQTARLADARTLEVTFEHARCADPAAIDAAAMGWETYDDGQQPPPQRVRIGVRELRRKPGEASCTGPVEKQTRRFDLRTVLTDHSIVRGELQLNEPSLYGYMKKLPTLTVRFDLR